MSSNPCIRELREKARAAIPGPWVKCYWPLAEPLAYHVARRDPDRFSSATLGAVAGPCADESTAAFIAAFSPDVAEVLLDAVVALRDLLEGSEGISVYPEGSFGFEFLAETQATARAILSRFDFNATEPPA